MKGSIVVIGFAVAVVIAGLVIAYSYFQDISTIEHDENPYKEWINSGPFHLQKDQYVLGENIFFSVAQLSPQLKGQIVFILPNGELYKSLEFDGSEKSGFNHYFTPELSKQLKICSVDDLVGTWEIKFLDENLRGMSKKITFKIIEEYLPGEKEDYEAIC